MTPSRIARVRVHELKAAQIRVRTVLGAFGLSSRMIGDYMGPRREELERIASAGGFVTLMRYRDRRECIDARELLELIVILASVEAELEEAYARKRLEAKERRQARNA